MDSIRPVESLLSQIETVRARPAAGSDAGGGFGAAMAAALKDVSAAQAGAADMQKRFQMEDPKVGLEDTMLAMNKATLGFQSLLQTRNKLVQAYSEIMNMQV
ncbi:flagellar hook-basal body complex protein FliE [Derxia gummosa]|uniref:Flagellar hook-basal body complex protein FliE n=1 Tax=Derxia gummosa DSM 723 TaxID=1121388 RepID=A0A8B6X5Y5_9BURK|nr:flagellar hook-basal body complex protein FliE [Derxia gummosa]